MISNLDTEIEKLLETRFRKNQLASQLGFFSKPIRVTKGNIEYVIKLYSPTRNKDIINTIKTNHQPYIDELSSIGINVPDTHLQEKKSGNKTVLVITQKAFEEKELVRGMIENGNHEIVLHVLKLMLDDCLKYWKNKPEKEIGFHPTTRNYALKDDQLHYFDTFPPMLMSQKKLNRIIIQMTPAKINIKPLVHQKWVNRVSDEYYQIDKMVSGITGSFCRLRPELKEEILETSWRIIEKTDVLNQHEKISTLNRIQTPPKLSGIWLGFRKLFGKTGKPNI